MKPPHDEKCIPVITDGCWHTSQGKQYCPLKEDCHYINNKDYILCSSNCKVINNK